MKFKFVYQFSKVDGCGKILFNNMRNFVRIFICDAKYKNQADSINEHCVSTSRVKGFEDKVKRKYSCNSDVFYNLQCLVDTTYDFWNQK